MNSKWRQVKPATKLPTSPQTPPYLASGISRNIGSANPGIAGAMPSIAESALNIAKSEPSIAESVTDNHDDDTNSQDDNGKVDRVPRRNLSIFNAFSAAALKVPYTSETYLTNMTEQKRRMDAFPVATRLTKTMRILQEMSM